MDVVVTMVKGFECFPCFNSLPFNNICWLRTYRCCAFDLFLSLHDYLLVLIVSVFIGLNNILFKYNLYIHIIDTSKTGFDSKHNAYI